MTMDQLARLATSRARSIFASDIENRRDEIAEEINGRRLLVIGGAGSIGASTIAAFTEFDPACIHVVDQNENQLTELVRDLRSRKQGLKIKDFRTLPLDFGSPIMQRFISESESYSHVLNFAALKHVRSEKDTFSLLQMVDTNLVKPARLLEWLKAKGGTKRYFCVSTDKAANPVNLMGASKRLMEHVIFGHEKSPGFITSSARFANVAFSEGSLLQGFQRRLEKRQPLAAPRETQRYFVSLEESGHICLLASTLAANRTLFVPKLDPKKDLVFLEEVAKAFLKLHSFAAKVYFDEEAARQAMVVDLKSSNYPLLLTPLDTAGEKPYEEFTGADETSMETGLESLKSVAYKPLKVGLLEQVLGQLNEWVSSPEHPVDKDRLVRLIESTLPEFSHNSRTQSLDERM